MHVFPPEDRKNWIEIMKTRQMNSYFPTSESWQDVIVGLKTWGNTHVFQLSFWNYETQIWLEQAKDLVQSGHCNDMGNKAKVVPLI